MTLKESLAAQAERGAIQNSDGAEKELKSPESCEEQNVIDMEGEENKDHIEEMDIEKNYELHQYQNQWNSTFWLISLLRKLLLGHIAIFYELIRLTILL